MRKIAVQQPSNGRDVVLCTRYDILMGCVPSYLQLLFTSDLLCWTWFLTRRRAIMPQGRDGFVTCHCVVYSHADFVCF